MRMSRAARSARWRGALLVSIGTAAGCTACQKPAPPPPPTPVVRVAAAEMRPVARTEELLATLDGSTNAEIRPQVTGIIESVDYQEGAVVAAGTLMFSIDERPFADAVSKAEGALAAATAQLKKARADVARYAPLVAEKAMSREDLDNARAAAEVAAANVRSTKAALETARLELEWTRVRSPIPGLAGIAQTRVGNLVNPSSLLTTVSTLDPIRATFALNERQYLRCGRVLARIDDPQHGGGEVLQLLLTGGKPYRFGPERVVMGREFNPATNTIAVQALFPNPGNVLRPGMFARVRIHGEPTPSVLVPDVAVQQLQGRSHVDVVDAQGRVETRPVQLGPEMSGFYVIESGVRPGERVIVAGQQRVQPGMKVEVEQSAAPPAPEAQSPQTPGTQGSGTRAPTTKPPAEPPPAERSPASQPGPPGGR